LPLHIHILHITLIHTYYWFSLPCYYHYIHITITFIHITDYWWYNITTATDTHYCIAFQYCYYIDIFMIFFIITLFIIIKLLLLLLSLLHYYMAIAIHIDTISHNNNRHYWLCYSHYHYCRLFISYYIRLLPYSHSNISSLPLIIDIGCHFISHWYW